MTLHVFLHQTHVGVVDKHSILTYDKDYTGPGVSLSLTPGDGPLDARAWLDNLLPDNEVVRDGYAREYGTTTAPLDLLAEIGLDLAGAVSLSPREDPAWPEPVLTEVSEDQLAGQLNRLRQGDYSALTPGLRRFSLGGYQPKLTLSRIGPRWYYPNWRAPSTHIFKPAVVTHPRLEELEVATLQLAGAHPLILATAAEVLRLDSGQHAFQAQRWDRVLSPDEPALALVAEDACQALGIAGVGYPKYAVELAAIVSLARRIGGEREVDRLLAQVGFNSAIGNADAHARNYSFVQTDEGWSVAPIYDTFPTFLVNPKYGNGLGLRVGGKLHRGQLGVKAVTRFAQACGVPPERLAQIWADVDAYVLASGLTWLDQVGLSPARRADWAKWLRKVERSSELFNQMAGCQVTGGI